MQMKHIFRRVLRPLLFAAGGAVVGVAYYYTAGCATGACPITSSPVTTAIYTAVIGLLLSMVLPPCRFLSPPAEKREKDSSIYGKKEPARALFRE